MRDVPQVSEAATVHGTRTVQTQDEGRTSALERGREVAVTTLRPYSEFQPTGFDHKGSFLPDQQHWLVLPMTVNRDSLALERANFDAARKRIPEAEVCRFGHWACGWFEIMIVDPAATATVAKAEALAEHFESYPVVDEELWSEYESEAAYALWENLSMRDRVEECRSARESIFAARHAIPPERVFDSLRESV